MPITFLHLSDIHFRGLRGSQFDLDRELRGELERHVAEFAEQHGAVDWVLVGGDVAFAGKAAEYDEAVDWLARLCELAKCERTSVLTVPGNHDVDWATVDRSSGLQSQHEELRRAPTAELAQRIGRMLSSDVEDRHLLLSPIEAYNAFAARFECQVTPDRLRWEKLLSLGDGYELRILGLTSILSSDRLDGKRDERKIVLGPLQCVIERRDKTTYLVLCHHPYEWLRDEDEAKDGLGKANFILFGHEHRSTAQQDGHVLRVDSGAVQPERDEGEWAPAFNLLRVDIRKGTPDKITVTVWPRVWDPDPDAHCFVPDRVDHVDYELELEVAIVKQKSTQPVSNDEPDMDRRELVYDFLSLPYSVGLDLAHSLGLLEETDGALPDGERYELIFSRARERGLLTTLRERIESIQLTDKGAS